MVGGGGLLACIWIPRIKPISINRTFVIGVLTCNILDSTRRWAGLAIIIIIILSLRGVCEKGADLVYLVCSSSLAQGISVRVDGLTNHPHIAYSSDNFFASNISIS